MKCKNLKGAISPNCRRQDQNCDRRRFNCCLRALCFLLVNLTILWYLYRTRDEYDTKNRQHVHLIRDLFINWLPGERVELCSGPRMLGYIQCVRISEVAWEIYRTHRCSVRVASICPCMGTAVWWEIKEPLELMLLFFYLRRYDERSKSWCCYSLVFVETFSWHYYFFRTFSLAGFGFFKSFLKCMWVLVFS